MYQNDLDGDSVPCWTIFWASLSAWIEQINSMHSFDIGPQQNLHRGGSECLRSSGRTIKELGSPESEGTSIVYSPYWQINSFRYIRASRMTKGLLKKKRLNPRSEEWSLWCGVKLDLRNTDDPLRAVGDSAARHRYHLESRTTWMPFFPAAIENQFPYPFSRSFRLFWLSIFVTSCRALRSWP